jgi:predicted nucleic-acid-binding Zn-ribbon protein
MLLLAILKLVHEGYSVEFTTSPEPQPRKDIHFTLKMRNGAVEVSKNFATDYYVHYFNEDYESTVVHILHETKADIINIVNNTIAVEETFNTDEVCENCGGTEFYNGVSSSHSARYCTICNQIIKC